MIRLEAVSKQYPGARAPAVANLSLEISEGDVSVLIGPSGCGKTTVLKLINRLIEPTGGRILIGGVDAASIPVHELRLRIGYVIQHVGLFPHRTVAQNVATVPRLLGWDRARIETRVDELIDLVRLDPGMRDRYPNELSGGQQQRVGVARALAADPPVLLMDEPFGAVDPLVRAELQRELLRLQERLRKTIVLVTHDIDEALLLGDRVAILNVGGHLEQYGSPEDVLRAPAGDFVEDFLGSERGLKRLALITLADVPLDRGPVVAPSTPTTDAARVMKEHGLDWIAVVDAERLLGWASAPALSGVSVAGDAEIRPFAVALSPSRSLREALDAIVTSETPVAVVCDGDRYLGMLTLDVLRREIEA